jgi:uncharacterized protein with NRDE domain
MCTLSIYSSKQQCIVTMNRDELRSRFEEGILFRRQDAELKYCYPVDADSKGTWFGANNNGVILCLLNRYQDIAQSNTLSRGIIIPTALKLGDAEKIKIHLKSLYYSSFQPFDLIMIYQQQLIHFQWNGQQATHQILEAKPWYMLTSSFLNAEQVKKYRHDLFKQWRIKLEDEKIHPEHIIKGFHLVQNETMKTHSILMEREKSHTKSIVQAHIKGKDLRLKYITNLLSLSTQEALLEHMVIKH